MRKVGEVVASRDVRQNERDRAGLRQGFLLIALLS
jgi:hypothetical protein